MYVLVSLIVCKLSTNRGINYATHLSAAEWPELKNYILNLILGELEAEPLEREVVLPAGEEIGDGPPIGRKGNACPGTPHWTDSQLCCWEHWGRDVLTEAIGVCQPTSTTALPLCGVWGIWRRAVGLCQPLWWRCQCFSSFLKPLKNPCSVPIPVWRPSPAAVLQ